MKESIVRDLFFVLAGILLLAFRNSWAKFVVESNMGFSNKRERDIRWTKIMAVIIGIVFIVMSLLSISGIIKIK